MTPQEAISDLHRAYNRIVTNLDNEKDVQEFNEKFYEWLEREFDLIVEHKK
jgi:hypothetical protein